jgi:UDP-N-acetylglucosamine:LPS N-acetylglucosamine transferase
MVAERLRARYGVPVYVVGESNREQPLKVLRVLARCVGIVLRERPDVIVSTGAAHGCLLCLLAKLAGARVVWIDSIANVERLSLSGRLVRPFADVVISQWPEVAAAYRGVEYHGALV